MNSTSSANLSNKVAFSRYMYSNAVQIRPSLGTSPSTCHSLWKEGRVLKLNLGGDVLPLVSNPDPTR